MLRPAVRNGCIILVYLKYSDNGQCAGCAIAEICHIPYYELFSANKEKAEQEVQDFYTRFLSGLLRTGETNSTAFEILFHSVPVRNQIYNAQVKLYFIIRHIGFDAASVTEKSILSSIILRKNLKVSTTVSMFLRAKPLLTICWRS